MWFGIDFSGNAAMWSMRCTRSNVWIATIDTKKVHALHTVQALPGEAPPFERLAAFLRETDFTAAGIDAPFTLPARYMPKGGHKALLKAVAKLPREGRPFAGGAALVGYAQAIHPLTVKKPVRETEQAWRAKGINVRSTLWNGPRGGAPFTAACLTLLHEAKRPCYPWARKGAGMMLETFPAAQLHTWGLPYIKYDGAGGAPARKIIVAALKKRVGLNRAIEKRVLNSADALDAVLCALMARAWSEGKQLDYGRPRDLAEGWIVVGD